MCFSNEKCSAHIKQYLKRDFSYKTAAKLILKGKWILKSKKVRKKMFLQRKFVRIIKWRTKMKPLFLNRFEKQPSRSAAGWPRCRFTLFVCVSVYPSLWTKMRTLWGKPLLGKNLKMILTLLMLDFRFQTWESGSREEISHRIPIWAQKVTFFVYRSRKIRKTNLTSFCF